MNFLDSVEDNIRRIESMFRIEMMEDDARMVMGGPRFEQRAQQR